MEKITKEQQIVICNQSKFCNGCEHSEKHIKYKMAFPDDCNESLCHHYNEYAKCVAPEDVIMETEKVTREQLEEIIERVEEGTTTQDDANTLRLVLVICGMILESQEAL